MRVAREDERRLRGARAAERVDRHVEARQASVDLQRRSGLLRGFDDRVEVELDSGAGADHARREVPDHAHRGVLHGGDDAPGLSRAVEVEVIVDRRQAPVERAAELAVVIELPRRPDVELHPVKQGERRSQLLLQGTDARALLEEGVAADARERALRVVGDREDAVAARASGRHDLLERRPSVPGDRRVDVEVAEDVADGGRQRAGLRRLDLAAVLAQDRRDPRKAERLVNLLLGLAGDDPAALDLRKRVLVERPPASERALAQLDVVPLRPREVEARRAELLGRHDPHVDLRSPARDDARLRVPADEDAVDDAHRDDRLHGGARRRRRDDDVDVADRLAEPAERPAVRRVRHARHLAQPRDDALGQRERHRDWRSFDRTLLLESRERLRELLLGLVAEPLEAAHSLVVEGLAKILQRLHPELGAQLLHGLRTQARDAHQGDDARGVLLPQAFELLHVPGVEQLADLGGRALADARDVLKLLGRETAEIGRVRRDRLGGALVGADAKRLGIPLLEYRQLGKLAQHVEDVLLRIAHAT